MATYRTPGVYVEEISTLPPSIAEVATAVPAFVGYTEIGPADNAAPVTARVSTLLEFETALCGPQRLAFSVTQSADKTSAPKAVMVAPTASFSLYYALSLYFRNGGGPCYVVSVGTYQATPSAARMSAGLAALEKQDEPTLIVLTDAACLLSAAD